MEFRTWNDTRPKDKDGKPKNRYGGRKFILSFADFHTEYQTLLFTGLFEIIEIREDCYKTRLVKNGSEAFIGKLKVTMKTGRTTIFKLPTALGRIKFKSIRETRYECVPFVGFENVCVSFSDLSVIIRKERLDWQSALANIKGIYLITDTNTGKLYVGKADGEAGLWSRWSAYIGNGHGGNKALRFIVDKEGHEYTRKFFQITLLEAHMRATDEFIYKREAYWKRALCSREHGLNEN